MKKIIIGISIIILASAVGLFIYFNTDRDLSNKKEEPKTEEKEETPEKNPYTIENKNNKELKKQKCHETLCIDDLIITKQAGIYAISASLKNISKTTIEDKAINLIFSDETGLSIKKTYYLLKVESEKEVPLEIHFTEAESNLMNVSNYKIEEATLNEYNLVKSTLDN